jgi:class 3 adenylate cyclase
MTGIADWLASLGLSEYAQCFAENAIDLSVVSDLTEQDLKDLGVFLGHRRKMLRAIAGMKGAVAAELEPGRTKPVPRTDAERRQLTILCCDLVGSSELAVRLDPEDLRRVIAAYHTSIKEVVALYQGVIARYLGDGVLAYFGYPHAHEGDAEQATRAGLALIGAVAAVQADVGIDLHVRVGIATGTVVVGDLIGEHTAQEEAVIGETPNLAARLQAHAEPDTVIIAGITRSLLGDLFEYRDLGSVRVKGFGEPVPVWQVIGASVLDSRFEALHGANLTPLVGREPEISLLLERWERAKEGDGQVVLLSGEPGIGKSRVVQELRDRLSDELYTRTSHYCSPYHTDSARPASIARTPPTPSSTSSRRCWRHRQPTFRKPRN